MLTEARPLRGDAKAAVEYRGGHLQIIAAAGSGKTEVVSQRVASLLAEGCPPNGVVAFTFTERAATSLKSRIERRVEQALSQDALNTLNGMFVGTIHSYAFNILQQHVPRYETFDVLDEHQVTAFLTRYAYDMGIPQGLSQGMFNAIRTFLTNLDVVENELLQPDDLEDPFREIYERYLAALETHRFLTYGQQIAKAVEQLQIPAVFDGIHGPLRHLIVDEYQDINPAQERLIARLGTRPVQVCVVGDDDQSIYQWRGSKVENIISFTARYTDVRTFSLTTNHRSRPDIIHTANGFAGSIIGRLAKQMRRHREPAGVTEVVCWRAETPEDEARLIAEAIERFHGQGHRYRDVAILCRGRVSMPVILDALAHRSIPVQPGGRTNLFLQPEADVFGQILCWLVGYEWRQAGYGAAGTTITLDDLMRALAALFDLSPATAKAAKGKLVAWKAKVEDERAPANLVRDYYELLHALGVDGWDPAGSDLVVNRLGTLARCSQVLVDYEATRRRARPDPQKPGEMQGGSDRGRKYHEWLAKYVLNWATGAYEGFEGEEDVPLDAVDLTTIHQAKGLEWPIVFVPALSARRFPSSNTGKARPWQISTDLFDRNRYEGSENDERRLFYVAMTRSRDYLSLSTFERMKNSAPTSPFLLEASGGSLPTLERLPDPPEPEGDDDDEDMLEITFSDLAAYGECGLAYRFRRLLGFQPPIVPELGYGKAVHHVLRAIADHVRRTGKVPNDKQLERLFTEEFYLPAANRPGHRQMRDRAKKLIERYIADWEDDLHNVWAVERPFELHLGDATVSGRADVIIKKDAEGEESLTIVDYKTATDPHTSHDFQLQVYTDAGRREGLRVDGAFVHDLKAADRLAVPVAQADIVAAEQRTRTLVAGLRAKEYVPNPGPNCSYCDVRELCVYRA